jgi:predicted alpha/beta-hydrolase family hydrolase
MKAWATRLAAFGTVTAFDYPYQREGRRRPDRQAALIEAHRAVVREARARQARARVILAGKSMGGRMGCHVSLEEPDVEALICFGYPLIGASGAVRDEVLRAVRRPVLFVQGTRDEMCPLDHLDRIRGEMQAPTEVHVVHTGDHSLLVTSAHTRATGRTQEDEDRSIEHAIDRFLGSIATGDA